MKLLPQINRRMFFAVLGALLIVGTALSFFQAGSECRKVDLYASPRYGAMWALLPAITYAITGNTFAMIVATWVPTIALVSLTDSTICKEQEALKEKK